MVKQLLGFILDVKLTDLRWTLKPMVFVGGCECSPLMQCVRLELERDYNERYCHTWALCERYCLKPRLVANSGVKHNHTHIIEKHGNCWLFVLNMISFYSSICYHCFFSFLVLFLLLVKGKERNMLLTIWQTKKFTLSD